MNIDLSKYLKNKEVEVNNDDFNLEKLSKDLLKGYVKESEVEKPDYSGYVAKADFDKLQSDYSTLENNYNTTVKTLSDTNDKMARVSLESKMVRKGFKDADFEEVAKLRTSIYADEKDDQKAIDIIAERYKNTFFEAEVKSPYTPAPNEAGIKGNGANQVHTDKDIVITRNTPLKNFMTISKK